MPPKPTTDPTTWREFERIIARIEETVGPLGMRVKSPDRIRSVITGRLREVDVSIRSKVGTADLLITIECRKRKPKQDVTWIEQLASKKQAVGAARTIAVSPIGFTSDAQAAARFYGIELRTLAEFSLGEINDLIRIQFVLFTRRHCAIAGLHVRYFRGFDGWTMPSRDSFDWAAPHDIDLKVPLFTNRDSGKSFSINDLWHELQEQTNPFEGIRVNSPREVRSVCFAYPGNVTMIANDTPQTIGDVILSVALWTTHEQVTLDDARKVQYTSADGQALQRVEFDWKEDEANSCRIALQIPKDSRNIDEVKVRFEPKHQRPIK